MYGYDFVIRDLLSGMHGFIQQTTDRLRLATAVSKDGPVFLSRSANGRQAADDLLKTWFRTTAGGQKYNIFVIIERMQIPESDDDTSHDPFAQRETLKRKDNKTKLISKEKERTKLSTKGEESMKSSIKEEERADSYVNSHGVIQLEQDNGWVTPWNPYLSSILRLNHDICFISTVTKGLSNLHYGFQSSVKWSRN